MRLLLSILVIATIGTGASWLTNMWWSAALVAGLVGLLSRLRTGEAFLAGFWGIALSWLAVMLYADVANDHLLSGRMAQLFKLPSYLIYIMLTFILGGIIGGLPAWAGAHLRKLFQSRPAR